MGDQPHRSRVSRSRNRSKCSGIWWRLCWPFWPALRSSLLFSYYQMSSFILTDFPITNQTLRLQITAPKYKHLLVPQGILTTLSMTNGRYRYDYATVPFLAEVFKVLFLLSALVFCRVKLKYFSQKEWKFSLNPWIETTVKEKNQRNKYFCIGLS